MAAYNHTVLVPEAVVMLIMEHMEVYQSLAIEILEESYDMGDLLHPADEEDMFP